MILANHGIISSSGGSGVPLLLDTYSGALAAYSLRKLNTAYTGYAIRVRRSSDNASQDIGFVNNVLDTASISSFVGANSGYVSIWYDQSGSSKNISQSTLVSQPLLVNNGSFITMNGKYSVLFNDGGADTFLQSSLFYSENPFHTFCYFKYNAINGVVFDGITNYNEYRINAPSSTQLQLYSEDGGSAIVYNDATGVLSKPLLSNVLGDYANTKFQINNNTATTGNWNFMKMTGLRIGKMGGNIGYNLNGYISEFIHYNSVQTSNENNIKTNINNYYSIY